MTALLLAPHNDDETLFASYLILRHRPKVIVCLRSERMHDPGYPGGPLAVTSEERVRETERALTVLAGGELELEQWDIGDADPYWRTKLWQKLHTVAGKGYEPWIVPAWENGGHEQHNALAEYVATPSSAGPLYAEPHEGYFVDQDKVISYLTYTSSGRSVDGTEVEFEADWPERKVAAMSCYLSQIEHPATAAHFNGHSLREYVRP